MRLAFRTFFISLILFSLLLSCWFVLHKDINFFTDIARDFLLFNEITQKKIILIGPRSSAGGLFHGPFWLYLNYPAYLLGHGNPVIVGWYWIFLIALFVIVCFLIGKKLFNEWVGLAYALLMATYFIFNANWLHNAFGALFCMPLVFFFFIRYIQTLRVGYLIYHVFVLGCMIDFEMAAGVPFTLLSFLYITIFVIIKKKYFHILAYTALPVILANYIIFDLRHNFLFVRGILHNASASAGNAKISLPMLLSNRLGFLIGLWLPMNATGIVLWTTTLLFVIFFLMQLKNNKSRSIYFAAAYFYLGYILITFASRNMLTTGQSLPAIPLVYLIFASLLTARYAKAFAVLFAVVYAISIFSVFSYFKSTKNFIGKSPESWLFLSQIAQTVFKQKDQDFGYFVYSPDAFGYQPKYAMFYEERLHPGRAHYLQKKPVTYIISAPPPTDNPYMQDAWWVKHITHINEKPQSVIIYPNGYKIERYLLSKEDIKTPIDINTDIGIFFR